ncbi:DUF4436 family protein [Chelatococcus reniformis]|uniref:DUF4436 domain-containing protein n=1 Tax=Chelatococcus reniformis TaxID=1494448 RepID=A0A916U4Y4_9HYPH|nr:DUF4436 family protein [Chelatococcus reniformis]GGC58872.1 hypothetical protein GCM10010994_17130 [Chelatococcus reniformis]
MESATREAASEEPEEEAPPAAADKPARRRLRRGLLLVALLVLCAVGYGLVLQRFDISEVPIEAQFGAPIDEAGLVLSLLPVAIDSTQETMQIRISVTPPPSPSGPRAAIATRDLTLRLHRDTFVEHIPIRAQQPLPELTRNFDLNDGSIRFYPVDRFSASVHLSVVEKGPGGSERALPLHVKMWEGILGFTVHGEQAAPIDPRDLNLSFSVRRTGAVKFFSITIYAAMVVLTLCALSIGSLVFIGFRKIEATLVGAMGAMVFALPALRNALPGAPPLGIRADVLVFFWAEIGAVVALSLFIAAWVRRGSRP